MEWLLGTLRLLGAVLIWGFHQMAALICAVYFCMTAYYWLEIRPVVQTSLVSAQPYLNEEPVMKSLRETAIKITGNSLGYIVRVIKPPAKKHLYRHLEAVVWTYWLSALYDDDSLYSMTLAKAYFGQDAQGNAVYGAREAAEKLFHTKLEKTSCEQRVQMVVMLKAPSLYKPGSERLVKGSQRFMSLCALQSLPEK
ncbi:transglycosylase domain-containing protein [Leminorella grimontii]|uniref:transglycosylase domain-containing protein n=1 Tax=Leminorella grimontii TaxID=82981 RepID=UPI0020896DB7|nr:transglycosylase domain-containing protein [Leminorella grimontii]GKX57898.1 hypothetical protein SOASR031_02130 [Leminorella grimontii]